MHSCEASLYFIYVSEISQTAACSFSQQYAKSGTATGIAFFHEDSPTMVFFDDAFRKRKSQPPTAFLCGEARTKHGAEMLFADAFAGICHIDGDMWAVMINIDGDAALARHGIDGILTQVFDDPLEQGWTDAHLGAIIGKAACKIYFVAGTTGDVICHIANDFLQIDFS